VKTMCEGTCVIKEDQSFERVCNTFNIFDAVWDSPMATSVQVLKRQLRKQIQRDLQQVSAAEIAEECVDVDVLC
jgi:crotonobetainyl-CoA:carnitine CoA-transferase CaiB-like acyl-CoA transferase